MTSLLAGMLLLPVAAAGGIKLVRAKPWQPPREGHRISACRSNLRQIGLACHMWADDHGERYPPDLQALVPNYLDDPRTFNCPRTASGYEYLPNRWAELPGYFFLAFDRRLHNNGAGFNVLYCDAHTEWWNASRLEEFNALLAAQEEVFERLRLHPDKLAEIFGEYHRRAAQVQRK
jgi:prepilin-type processing-associated H-X9-DG protein